jgi:glycosyltransferase involved in cell wall biosynthesis
MMKQTLEALARVKYPNFEVIVVDNNTTDENVWRPVEQTCAILGQRFKFFHLEKWPGYKGGALNFALQQTDPQANIVGVIDADYTVSPDWLDAVVPHFDDPKVALVQCPQDNRGWRRNPFKEMINWEYAGFFYLGMPHRNEEDAIIQHGTMCLMRRDAMKELNDWATWCICEDSELGLRLMKAGYRTVYVNQVLGQGIVPDDFAAYKKQRSRWAYGAIQILRRHWDAVFSLGKHEEGKTLTPAQRYHFIAGWLPWVGDSLHLLFTLLMLVGTALMIAFPRYFMMPAAAFFLPVLLITPFNIVRSVWLYQRRVPCSVRQGLAACVAGLGLTYTIGRSCLYSMVSTKRPFGRTPKCQSNSALSRCLAMARDETVLAALLWVGLAGLVLSRPHINNTQSVTWLACLALQSLPYLAAMACAVVNSLPAINTAAASFGQRRAAVLARRAKAEAQAPVPQPVPVPVSVSATSNGN